MLKESKRVPLNCDYTEEVAFEYTQIIEGKKQQQRKSELQLCKRRKKKNYSTVRYLM